MDIEALKTFMVLANTKNYTRAASQLFVAQSTVTSIRTQGRIGYGTLLMLLNVLGRDGLYRQESTQQ